MYRLSFLLLAAVLLPNVGCEWMKNNWKKDERPKGTGALPHVEPVQLVNYLNERSARLQSLSYADVRMSARDHNNTLPALHGYLDASQPRNFRMVADRLGAKVDLGSNPEQFWVYFDAPTVSPMYVYASHTDFEAGTAKLPGGIPFEPDWVMQALGMATFPPPDDRPDLPPGTPTNRYTVTPDDKAHTYTLSWPAVTPNKVSIVKEIVFDGAAATGNRPQVMRHVIRDTTGKVICLADIKTAHTIDAQNRQSAVQYPTHVVLKWEEQKFEMELRLRNGEANKGFTAEQARRLFNRPNIPGAKPIDLAKYEFPVR
jgi:hypothetical protein